MFVQPVETPILSSTRNRVFIRRHFFVPLFLAPSIEASLTQAAAQGLLAQGQARTLVSARALFSELLQRERLRSTEASPINWNDGSILRNMARELGVASGAALTRKVEALRAEVKEIYERVVRAG